MSLNIVRAEEPIKVTAAKVMIYGQPGVGKTSTAFTADTPLLIDCDKGAYRSGFRKDSVQVNSWSDIESISAEDVAPYNTIVIDTGGRALDFLAQALMKENPKLGYNGGLTLQGYGQLKVRFAAWASGLTLLGKDLVIVCHDVEKQRGDDTVFRPDVQGGSYGEIFKIADAVGYMYSGDDNHTVLDFNPTNKWEGKNSAQLPPIKVPNFNVEGDFFAGVLTKIKDSLNAMGEEAKQIADIVSGKRQDYSKMKTAKAFNEALEELNTLPSMAKPSCKRLLWERSKEAGLEFADGKFKAAPKKNPEKKSEDDSADSKDGDNAEK